MALLPTKGPLSTKKCSFGVSVLLTVTLTLDTFCAVQLTTPVAKHGLVEMIEPVFGVKVMVPEGLAGGGGVGVTVD